ncbi:MAG: GNAT family N-acetyltransferase [Alphaproteobacteria bacterium]|nr:GNAT family N-acetyltransferase [Alphaproteobacteria bacterium]
MDLDCRFEPLDGCHDRAAFRCGVESLDTYLRTQASQDMRRKANAVFVLVTPQERQRIIGYFTLCAHTLAQGAVPEAARRHIPRYPLVSATLSGRLAIARQEQGRGWGAVILTRALRVSYDNAAIVGSSMVVVDAISEEAATFYEAHGFTRLVDSFRLAMPMATIADAIKAAGN